MFRCDECNKKYSSQNSLARHVHNHRRSTQHICSVCNVVFYRRDLLSRHARLHQEPSPGREPDARPQLQTESSPQRRRKRCHTACIRCRELRAKCSGQSPCHTCVKTGLHCVFSARSSRISHQTRSNLDLGDSREAHNSVNLKVNYRQLDRHLSDVESSLSIVHLDSFNLAIDRHHGLDRTHNADTAGSSPHLHESLDNPGLHATASTNSSDQILPADGLMSLAPGSDNSLSWPWLHESLFLPNAQNSANRFLDTSHSQFQLDRLGLLDNTAATRQPPVMEFPPGDESWSSHTWLEADQPVRTAVAGLLGLQGAVAAEATIGDLRSGFMESISPALPIQGAASGRVADIAIETMRSQIVSELVTHAVFTSPSSQQSLENQTIWTSMSLRIADAFAVEPTSGYPSSSTLRRFVDLYFEHFGALWPLLSHQTLDLDTMHPLLFLVLSSIGAMYAGPSGSQYGADMHKQVRIPLTAALELDDTNGDFMWLAQARLLTQVAALYFGQSKAISYSHHLGALLVAQARRMDLFSSSLSRNSIREFRHSYENSSDAERLSLWLQAETRRRLAFGIFRADTYTSLLLHKKPLVSLEEIDLEFPKCDAVWRGRKMSPDICLHMIDNDPIPSADMLASDLFRIAQDQGESLPPLAPSAYELLMFGMQGPLWSFCHNQETLRRLTGKEMECVQSQSMQSMQCNSSEPSHFAPTDVNTAALTRLAGNMDLPSRPEAHSLESSPRVMADMQAESCRYINMLNKWERSLALVKTFTQTDLGRTSLLSGLLLFHMGYMRINAPIEDLHLIQYHLADHRCVDQGLLKLVYDWAGSPRARLAVERACAIWSLISNEVQGKQSARAKFNLLAFTGLHHSSVVLWAFAGARSNEGTTREHSESFMPSVDAVDGTSVSIPIRSSEYARLLTSLEALYHAISPARWSSFAQAARALFSQALPAR